MNPERKRLGGDRLDRAATVITGRIRGKALQPADYRAVFVPITAAGASAAKTVNFTIAKH